MGLTVGGCSFVQRPAGAQVEARVYWRLLGREGMYDARQVLDEVASEIVYFAAARGEIPPTGVDLKVELLADTR